MRKLEETPVPETEKRASILLSRLLSRIFWWVWRHLMIYRRISFDSNLTIEQAVSKLSAITMQKEIYFSWTNESIPQFLGKVSADGFELDNNFGGTFRIGMYPGSSGNSFLPAFSGKFIQTDNGLHVDVDISFDELAVFGIMASGFMFLLTFVGEFYEFNVSLVFYTTICFMGIIASFLLGHAKAKADEHLIIDLLVDSSQVKGVIRNTGLLTIDLPTQAPLNNWKEIPIMPKAIAGDETFTGYQFVVDASPTDVKDYYLKILPEYGWEYEANKPVEPGRYFSILPNNQDDLILYLGSSSNFMNIAREINVTRVTIHLVSNPLQQI